jgi:superfamily II DNA or RNA helicase
MAEARTDFPMETESVSTIRRRFIRRQTKDAFVFYPLMTEENAYDKLFWKQEFLNTRYTPDFRFTTSEDACKHRKREDFELQNPQEFVKNLISPETPYNGLLVLHGTGVGKTCSAIGITEGLRDYVRKHEQKIYIITPSENIRENFLKELRVTGCASHSYESKKMVDEYYTFMGFGQFSNFVDKILKQKPEEMVRHFSNSVIIIDEAHGIAKPPGKNEEDDAGAEGVEGAEGAEGVEGVDGVIGVDGINDMDFDEVESEKEEEVQVSSHTRRTLFSVLTKTIIPPCLNQGLKIILLTATPMKDNITEIADLLEILNANDGRALPPDFRANLKVSIEAVAHDLYEFSKGYVSFARGNNPISFPLEVTPPEHLLYSPHPRYAFKDQRELVYRTDPTDTTEENDNEFDIYFNGKKYQFNLFKCLMGDYQFAVYQSISQSPVKNYNQQLQWVSNMVLPSKPGVPFTDATETFNQCFGKLKKDSELGIRYELKEQALPLRTNLSRYSGKLANFVSAVGASPGIAFAYSEFINYGTKMMAFILELHGFLHYHPDLYKAENLTNGLPSEAFLPSCTLLKFKRTESSYVCATCGENYANHRSKGHRFLFSTYILITGDTDKKNRLQFIEHARTNPAQCSTCGKVHLDGADHPFVNTGVNASPPGGPLDQRYGQVIKVIIGTRIIGQGVDFKWIRQVHILEPWHNNTRIYQVIGRGLRHCSHADLPKAERDVMVFRYCATVPPEAASIETMDEHIYARVIRKDIRVKQIERVLKANAVDCEFNKNRNIFPTMEDYSRECDYMECAYTCAGYKQPIQYHRIRIGRILDPHPMWEHQQWFIHEKPVDREELPPDLDFALLPKVNESTVLLTGQNGDIIYLTRANNRYYIQEPLAKFGLIPEVTYLLAPLENVDRTNNTEIWKALLRLGGKVVKHVQSATDTRPDALYLYLDMPYNGKIDKSTYDLYFQQPIIRKVSKIITGLYREKIIYTLKSLTYYVKSEMPDLDDAVIYLALDLLLSGKAPLLDRYSRTGHLITQGPFYIFQPDVFLDPRIPLYYRNIPLSVKPLTIDFETAASVAVLPLKYNPDHFLIERADDIMDVLHVFRYLDGSLGLGKSQIPIPTIDMHIEILEGFTTKYYEGKLSPREQNTYYVIVEYFIRSSVLYFCSSDAPLDVGEQDEGDVVSIPSLLEECKYVVHVLRGQISYLDVRQPAEWSHEDNEIKTRFFEGGDLLIGNRQFVPMVGTARAYWCFFRPKIGEKDKDEGPSIYGFLSGAEKNVVKPITLDAQGRMTINFNSFHDMIANARQEEKGEISLKLLTNENKTGKACKSFKAGIRETIAESTIEQALASVITLFRLDSNVKFLQWTTEVKRKSPKNVVEFQRAGFKAWYDSIEKSCEFFELTTRLLDYCQFANKQWFFNKYMIHYYFKKNTRKADKSEKTEKAEKTVDEEEDS